jgi:hypothetical protein
MLVSESYGGELHFLGEFFWFVDFSSVYDVGCFMFFVKSSGVSFLSSSHSVTSMQQSAFLRQLMADVAYWILFLQMVFVFDAVWL